MSALIAIHMEKCERRKSLAIYVSYVVSIIFLDENVNILTPTCLKKDPVCKFGTSIFPHLGRGHTLRMTAIFGPFSTPSPL